MLGEASDNLVKVEKCITQTSALRGRFEDDFDLYRTEKFEMSKSEGVWDNYTSNRATREANKLINILASSRLKLWIPLTDEDEKKRKSLSKTERFPYGVIALRDSVYGTVPEALPLQASMSWFAPLRGWMVLLCYLYEEEDGKNGKVLPHIAVWDILNTYWISGSKGLLWACYKRYASSEDVKDQYKQDVKPDDKGRVELHNVWDGEEFGTIAEKAWLKKPEAHKCGHIPVLILPGGSISLIQSDRHDDTIKNLGESMYVNNRHLYSVEHRLGTYFFTMTGKAAKAPTYHYFDSTKGGLPPEFDNDPSQKGAHTPIDIGKGEDIKPGTTPEMTHDAYSFLENVKQSLDAGGLAPLPTSSGIPAAGLNIYRQDSLERMMTAKKLMERSYVWLAHEIVSQYKNGGFEGIEIQGVDGSNRIFKFKVKPTDIDDSWNFEAKLVTDLPQDDMANMGMAVQAVESELLSRQTARDRYSLVDDTDQEQRNLDREKAYKVAAVQMRRVAAALKEDGDDEGAQYIMDEIERTRTEQKPGVASQPGIPSPVRPSADTSAVVPQPPQASGLRKFLSRFGV